MKGHIPSRPPSAAERKALSQSKQAPDTDAHWNSPAKIASLIATGHITRGNSCDGKARFRTYDYAEMVRPKLEAKHNTRLETYACVYCSGWHTASREEFAA